MSDRRALLTGIREIRVDCVFGYRTHFAARDRLTRRREFCITASYVASTLTGSAFLVLLADMLANIAAWVSVVGALMSVVAASTSFAADRLAQQIRMHEIVGDRYRVIGRSARLALRRSEAGTFDSAALDGELVALNDAYSSASQIAASAPTSTKDYEHARSAIRTGQASYDDDDMQV